MLNIFCTKPNQQPANELAQALKSQVITCTVKTFSSNEKFLSFEHISPSFDAIIVHELWPNFEVKIIELLLLLDILADNNFNSVTLITPYLPYLRQDRVLEINSSIGARMLAQIFKNTIIHKIVTVDIHSNNALSFFKQKLMNINCARFFASKLQLLGLPPKSLILSPDKGSTQRAVDLSVLLNFPYATLNKQRRDDQIIISSIGENSYQSIIIIDDIIDSGSTIAATINVIKNQTEQIFVCATHILNLNVIQQIKLLHHNIHVLTTNSTNYNNKNAHNNIWEVIKNYLNNINPN